MSEMELEKRLHVRRRIISLYVSDEGEVCAMSQMGM
jgi:hypothetical protein